MNTVYTYLKLLLPETFFQPKMHQKSVWRPGYALIGWGSLQRYPRPPSWIKGSLLLREGVGREWRDGRTGVREGRGSTKVGRGMGRGGWGRDRGPTFIDPWYAPGRLQRYWDCCCCYDDDDDDGRCHWQRRWRTPAIKTCLRDFCNASRNDSGHVVHTRVPLFAKQYKLLPVKGRWCYEAGKVTVDLSGVALALRHRLSGMSIYGHNGLRKGDEHPTYEAVKYGTFTIEVGEVWLQVSVCMFVCLSVCLSHYSQPWS